MRTPTLFVASTLLLAACGNTWPTDDRVTQPPPEGVAVTLPDGELPAHRGVVTDEALSGAIDARVLRYLRTSDLAGAAVVVVRNGEVLHTAGYGWADIATEREMTANTPVLLASISKTFLGISAMQLVEEGRLDLDAPVSDYTGFAVDNPHVNGVITVRHAMTHSAGIFDTDMFYGQFVPGDHPLDMETYVESYLTPGGDNYRAGNWLDSPSGSEGVYSNVSAGLGAVAVARTDGKSFRHVAQQRILDPLGMDHSGFLLADLPEPPATGYSVDGGELRTWESFGYPNYVDGLMRSSANDMGAYLAAVVDGQLLGSDAQRTMLTRQEGVSTPQDDGQGILWALRDVRGRHLAGHSGYHWGATTEMWFDTETGSGYLLALNTNPRWTNGGKRLALEEALLTFAEDGVQ